MKFGRVADNAIGGGRWAAVRYEAPDAAGAKPMRLAAFLLPSDGAGASLLGRRTQQAVACLGRSESLFAAAVRRLHALARVEARQPDRQGQRENLAEGCPPDDHRSSV